MREATGMRRRDFVGGLGGIAAAAGCSWPVTAKAQQQDGRVRRVGVLMGYEESDPDGQARLQAFREGLADLRWLEGRNLRFDVRWAGSDALHQQGYARELVALAPEVILAATTAVTLALKHAT